MPRTSEQFEIMRKEREESILNAGLYLFATKGYDATSIDAVAKIVNCSHGLIFHYYKAKEDLYSAVIFKIVRPNIYNLVKDVNFTEKAKFVFTNIVEIFLNALKNPNDEYAWSIALLLDIHLQTIINPRVKKTDSTRKVYDQLFELIERGKLENDFKDLNTKELSITLLALFKGLSYNRIKVGHKKFVCPKSKIILDMVLK